MQCDKVHRHDAESWLTSHEQLFSAVFQEYHVIHVDILSSVPQAKIPHGQTVNHQRLRKRVFVRQAIKDNWMLHHDNAPCHTAF